MDRTYGWGVLPSIDGYFYIKYNTGKCACIDTYDIIPADGVYMVLITCDV